MPSLLVPMRQFGHSMSKPAFFGERSAERELNRIVI
jgi:hypothetical protein